MRMKKEYYYDVCAEGQKMNVDEGGNTRPVQTRLSFGPVLRKEDVPRDTKKGELGSYTDNTVG